MCRGAAVGIPSSEGFLIWNVSVSDLSIQLRRFRRKANHALHFVLFAGIIVLVGIFFWNVLQSFTFSDLGTFSFWFSGYWFVGLFYLAIVLSAFFIFRLAEYTAEAEMLPGWFPAQKTKKVVPTHSQDVWPFFSEEAKVVVEQAYQFAKDMDRVEVTPEILFTSALAGKQGSLLLARLGLSFESAKDVLTRVILAQSGGAPPISFSRSARRSLVAAYVYANRLQRKHVTPIEIFVQAFLDSEVLPDAFDRAGVPPEHLVHVARWISLQDRVREDHERFSELARLKPKTGMNRAMTAIATPMLDRYGEDLTQLARRGYLAPIVGQSETMDRLFRAFESGRSAVALIGKTGCGKSAIVEQLARQMAEEHVPGVLFDRRLVSVDLARLVGGGDAGDAAERLLALLREVAFSGNIVLALYGSEVLAGRSGGALDLAEIVASELERGGFYVIGTVTPDAWTTSLESRSLGTVMTPIMVPEPDPNQTVDILMLRSASIEVRQRVYFSYAALEKATDLSRRFLRDVAAPLNALQVIREAAVLARKTRGEGVFVTAEDVAKIVHEKTRIPVEVVTEGESERLLNLESVMHERMVGQDVAVSAVAQAIRRARTSLREGNRPIANFLFLGPTGVGKTECAKTLAQEYFGSENVMIRLDMSEYTDPASVVRMIGSPGDTRGGLLTEAVRKQPFSLVLCDEIEKAHSDIRTLFLQVMDDGRLTDGVGRTVDFTNTILIMTSNAGSEYIRSAVSEGTDLDTIRTILLEQELSGIFRPEFLNRFDQTIVFEPLSRENVRLIAERMLNRLGDRLSEQGFLFRADPSAITRLAEAGFDPAFGARPLRRVIQDRVEAPLADLLLRQRPQRRDTIVLRSDGTLAVESAEGPTA